MSRDHDHDQRQGREREEKHHHHHDKEKTGSYTPEFLQTMAKSDGPTKAEFDVISGADAVTFARKFVRCVFVSFLWLVSFGLDGGGFIACEYPCTGLFLGSFDVLSPSL
jgi:hypothetical protein